jgi:hypothetical protein
MSEKQKFPVQLIIQGDVEAYAPEQIRDEVSMYISDATELLFGSWYPHQLLVGERELNFTGMKKSQLLEYTANCIYEDEREFRSKVYNRLDGAKDLFEESSGIIFKHDGSANAAKYVSILMSEMIIPVTKPFDKLSETEKAPYLKRAESILSRSIWWTTKACLLKEG